MANMDGTSVKIIAAARDVEMSCITVDHVTNIAYWSERTNFRDYIKAIRLEDQKTKVGDVVFDLYAVSPIFFALHSIRIRSLLHELINFLQMNRISEH